MGKWQSKKFLRQHLQSHRYQKLLYSIELSARAPETGYYHITQTGGLEVIEDVSTQRI